MTLSGIKLYEDKTVYNQQLQITGSVFAALNLVNLAIFFKTHLY